MNDDIRIKAHKIMSKIKNDSELKECFVKNENCNGIIRAHRIQMNGPLKLLEESVNGNNKLIHFGSFDRVNEKPFQKFKYLGKKTTSTFKGFCNSHDTELFKEIENNLFDLENDKHCFFYSFRALAGEYHNFAEGVNRAFHPIMKSIQKNKENNRQIFELVSKFEMLKGLKFIFNKWIIDQEYSELYYDGFKLEYSTPFTTSYLFWYPYDRVGNFTPSFFIFNIIPDKQNTNFLFATFRNDKDSIKYINDILSLDEYRQNLRLTNLLINSSTVLRPSFWENFTEDEKENVMYKISRHAGISYSNKKRKRMKQIRLNFFKEI